MSEGSSSQIEPRFSICIPNYNYGRYLESTLSGVFAQDFPSFEVLVTDNASTDDSVQVVRTFDDPRLHLEINPTNVGLGPNLDRTAGRARGDIMILLSSDDLMRPGALEIYDRIFSTAPDETMLVASTVERVDSRGDVVAIDPIDQWLWNDAVVDTDLSEQVGHRVLTLSPETLLHRCLSTMRTPFTFAATAYSRSLYHETGGYRGNRFYGPDKWFHWLTLAKADRVYLVDAPYFAYRWHDDNQVAIEASRSSLRFLLDDYLNTMEAPEWLLSAAGLTRDELIEAFVEYDIGRHGLASLARGNRIRARQVLDFGTAAYRTQTMRNPKVKLLRWAMATGPLGEHLVRIARRRVRVSGAQPRGSGSS